MMNEILKQLNLIKELGTNDRYKKIVEDLQELLDDVNAVGFSAYLENGLLKTSFHFNEEDLYINTIKNRK